MGQVSSRPRVDAPRWTTTGWDGRSWVETGAFVELLPADVEAMRAYAAERRMAATPLDLIVEGVTPGDDPAAAADKVRSWAEHGATWWIESQWATPDPAGVLQRIQQGPPRLD